MIQVQSRALLPEFIDYVMEAVNGRQKARTTANKGANKEL